jgi:hypothetical protein
MALLRPTKKDPTAAIGGRLALNCGGQPTHRGIEALPEDVRLLIKMTFRPAHKIDGALTIKQ